MNVAITGSSGFIGSHLSSRLAVFGHQVTPLWRYLFTQDSVDCLAEALAGCHAVINLAGAPIDRRWTDAYKQELVESRIMTTRKLVEAVNRLHEPPEVMISTSAVGYYSPAGGCHGDQDDPAADPERTTNREFYKAAAEHFHTRLSIHVPDAVLRLLMGEASQVITNGQCAIPETLMREGFEFQYPDIRTFFNKAFPVKS